MLAEWSDWKLNGQGIKYSANGTISDSGIYKDNVRVTAQYIDPNSFTRITKNNSAIELEAQRKVEERRKLEEEKRQSEQAQSNTNEPMKFGPFISNFQASTDFKTGHEADDKARELFANDGIESNIDFAMSGIRDGLFIVSWQFFEPSMAFSADQLTSSIPTFEFVKKADTKVFPSSTNNANRFEYAIYRATGFSNDNLTFTSKGKSRLVGYWVNLPIQFKNSKDEMLSGLLSVFYRGIETESRKNKIDSVIPAFMNSLEFKSGFSKISYENYKAEIQKKNIQRELETEEKPTSSKVIPKEQINQPQVVNLVKGLKDCDECPEMAVLPAGSFLMGSPPDPEPDPFSNVEPVKIAENSEMPQHRVNIKSFLIGKYEVTQEQWFAVMRKNPSKNKGRTLPVENVSCEDAQLFVQKLSQKTGKKYRLPSESEWEYAARAGSTTAYPWGISDVELHVHAWVFKVANATNPVGLKTPNQFGLYDMIGNVWEWTQDCWNQNYSGAPTDGSAWTKGECSRRVLRGGSWDTLQNLRSAIRHGRATSGRSRFTDAITEIRYGGDRGFRVARDP